MAFEAPRDVLALVITEDDMRRTPKPVTVNVVATYNFGNASINTELLTLRLPGTGYNPSQFAAAKLRFPRPMTLAFSGGCAVCPGSRSVMDARLAAVRFVSFHLRCGELVQYQRFRVQNIVMSVWLPFELDIAQLIEEWSAHAEYTPSRFPGASFRFGCGDGTIVFNVFVTGRVIITRSRNEQHSYRAWYWFYTNVLVRHQLGTAAGTTNSSAYRMATHRRNDTFADDCSRISSRHLRRRDGPMARSERFSAFIAETPRTARIHAPMTARIAAAATSNAFAEHSRACFYHNRSRREWYSEYMSLETRGTCSHRAATDCRVFSNERLLEQLAAAIGRHRLERVHGEDAPFHGHSLECAAVSVPPESAHALWTAERERVEAALGGVEPLADVFAPHRAAGCFSADPADADDEDIARLYITQLHVACHDFDDEMLALEDVIDHEARYRLEALRGSGESTEAFSLDDNDPQ
jgi:TATA-box binding protein (TBP) (component of TFIID and TFIIIB)